MGELDPCPECGRDNFGNAGARASHVQSCRSESEPVTLNTTDEGNNGSPARQTDGATSAGEQVGIGLSVATDENAPTEERVAAVQDAASLLGGLISGGIKYREQKQEQAERRATNANIEPVENKPSCTNCGAVFDAIPPGADRVRCPECGHVYRVVE